MKLNLPTTFTTLLETYNLSLCYRKPWSIIQKKEGSILGFFRTKQVDVRWDPLINFSPPITLQRAKELTKDCTLSFDGRVITVIQKIEAIRNLVKLGQDSADAGDHQKAANDYEKALNLIRSSQHPEIEVCERAALKGLIDSNCILSNQENGEEKVHRLYDTGVLYERMGQFDAALQQWDTALKLAKELNSPFEIFSILEELGDFYTKQNNIERAIDYFLEFEKEATRFQKETIDAWEHSIVSSGLSSSLKKLASLYEGQNKPKKAQKYRNKAQSILPTLIEVVKS